MEWIYSYNTDLEEVKFDEYPNLIYWMKNEEVLFEQYLKTKLLIINYRKIWSVFEYKYGYSDNDIKILINNIVEKQLNWKGFIPSYVYRNII